MSYRRSIRATSLVLLAWVSMDAAACVRMLYLDKFELSSAMSTSSIRPRAARILVCCTDKVSAAKLSLDICPPTWARRKDIFSNACWKTPIDTSSKSQVLLESSAAKENNWLVSLWAVVWVFVVVHLASVPLPSASVFLRSSASIVSAASSPALCKLILDPS